MILAAALLLGAALVIWWAPRPLHRLALSRMDPRAVIACWLAAVTGVAVSVIAAVTLLALPHHGPAGAIAHALNASWAGYGHEDFPDLDQIVAVPCLVIVTAVAWRLGKSAVIRRRRSTLLQDRHLEALRILHPDSSGDVRTLWLDHDRPMAYSVGGRQALVVATQGLADRLSTQELRAVFAHEHAHLRGRHHRLIGFAEVVGKALWFLPLTRQAPVALRILAELAADRAAAAECGIDPLRSALVTLCGSDCPPQSLAMSGADTHLRLQRLATAGPISRARTHLLAAASITTAALAPLLTASTLLLCADLTLRL
ncbi:M56 family metallopeptidase [Amycolatopsis anabasis]|uniref:M56 family metallopeptidase n=1 Tax=Amycolatopsis anabasis TaxID=1840409 RepID=UPI00131E0DDC|nr:M56 family metallopeptidase [Amycolatopsis anabasis]